MENHIEHKKLNIQFSQFSYDYWILLNGWKKRRDSEYIHLWSLRCWNWYAHARLIVDFLLFQWILVLVINYRLTNRMKQFWERIGLMIKEIQSRIWNDLIRESFGKSWIEGLINQLSMIVGRCIIKLGSFPKITIDLS